MSINEMRETVKAYYKHSTTWGQKVNRMTDNQVMAIFFRWKQENKI